MTKVFNGRQQAAAKFKEGYDELCKQRGERSISQITETIAIKHPRTR